MSKSESSSRSSSSTTTQNTDNRIAAEEGSIVFGTNSNVDIIDNFPEEVQELAKEIFHFATDAGDAAVGIAKQSMHSVDKANDALIKKYTETEFGESTAIMKVLGIAGMLVVGVVALKALKH